MSMNIFRLCGDLSHMIAIALLILQLFRARNARGISLKTQELFLLVFVTRYLDLFTTFYSLYNSAVKVAYITATFMTIMMIRCWEPIKMFYNANQDSFPHWKCAVLPCALLALATHLVASGGTRYFDLLELLWTFSIYLESVAILPQLMTLRKYGLVENLTGNFIFCLGLYRFLYILNWIYRAHTERGYQHHWVVYSCGVIQTLMYADFFFQYCRASPRLGSCCRNNRRDELSDDGDNDDEGLVFEFSHRNNRESVGETATETLL